MTGLKNGNVTKGTAVIGAGAATLVTSFVAVQDVLTGVATLALGATAVKVGIDILMGVPRPKRGDGLGLPVLTVCGLAVIAMGVSVMLDRGVLMGIVGIAVGVAVIGYVLAELAPSSMQASLRRHWTRLVTEPDAPDSSSSNSKSPPRRR